MPLGSLACRLQRPHVLAPPPDLPMMAVQREARRDLVRPPDGVISTSTSTYSKKRVLTVLNCTLFRIWPFSSIQLAASAALPRVVYSECALPTLSSASSRSPNEKAKAVYRLEFVREPELFIALPRFDETIPCPLVLSLMTEDPSQLPHAVRDPVPTLLASHQ